MTNDMLISGLAAIVLYLVATLYLGWQLKYRPALNKPGLVAVSTLALLCHGVAAAAMVFTDQGVNFSLWHISTAIFFAVNLIVLASSLKKPVESLFLLLFPITALTLLLALLFGAETLPSTHISAHLAVHILLSLLAYCLFTIAAGQALLLAYQDRRLKNHHPGGLLRKLPPLQTMEALLFEVLWGGFVLLTLALVTGFMFVEDFMAQHLAHKTLFSVLAWLVYGTLLWGRYRLGWRGATAIRWTLSGFAALFLAYWGSKFVIEVLLQ